MRKYIKIETRSKLKLTKLHLEFFKNHLEADFSFPSRITSVVGENGIGKTNLVDALYYLSMAKSAFSIPDSQNISHGKPYFLIKGEFEGGDFQMMKCYLEKGQKKILQTDEINAEKLSDHLGRFIVVLSNPLDSDIIRNSSEIRRKWIDSILSTVDKGYLDMLVHYQRTLKQRNSMLKLAEGRLTKNDTILLESYDDLLIPLCQNISARRKEFIASFLPFFIENTSQLVEGIEKSEILYETNCDHKEFPTFFKEARDKDLITQRTNIGIHRDDFNFVLNDYPIRKFGSQGQQKTFLIALRLAQFDYLSSITSEKPILLLDDVFDKLDDNRIKSLSAVLLNEDRIGQVIITDARSERTKKIFKKFPDLGIIEMNKSTK